MKRDLTTILYVRRLPNKPKVVEGSYSLYGVKKLWGPQKVKQLLTEGEAQVGYYEWLELEPTKGG